MGGQTQPKRLNTRINCLFLNNEYYSMARNTDILTISIPKEQGEFLERLNISPSKIFQQKIEELMLRSDELNKAIEDIEAWKKLSARNLQDFTNFLQSEGIDYSKFLDWKQRGQNGSDKLV